MGAAGKSLRLARLDKQAFELTVVEFGDALEEAARLVKVTAANVILPARLRINSSPIRK